MTRFIPWNGDLGEEVETVEVLPEKAPMSTPEPVTVPAEPEKVGV